jgi:hypothetical protein
MNHVTVGVKYVELSLQKSVAKEFLDDPFPLYRFIVDNVI